VLDIRRIRTELDVVKAAIARRGVDTSVLDRVASLDRDQRRLGEQRDSTRSEIAGLSKQVGQLRREGRVDEALTIQERSRELGAQETLLTGQADALETEIREALLRVGNLPADECPDGASEDDNVVLRVHGYDPESYAAHQRVPHWDIGNALGILDVERGTKMSGAMFVMYRKQGAALVRALTQLALDRNVDAYEEIRPPTLVRTDTMVATGHLPKFEDEAYHLERDDLWAIPTAEVPLTSLARDEILDEARLPMKLMAHTSCFRREAGSAGRDTRGLLRVH
jgi:seryl-tRNA synthetase